MTNPIYMAITVFSFLGTVLAVRLLIGLKRHYGYVEEFGSAIGFLKSEKFLQYVQVLSISILLWLASILSTISVSVIDAGHIVTRMFELLAVITFVVGCYTALDVIQKYESKGLI